MSILNSPNSEEFAMHEVLKNRFPYSMQDYDSKFINRAVIEYLRNFCSRFPVIKEFYARGSIIHGCMVQGSDIDHVRIKVEGGLDLSEKIELVDKLERGLQEFGVSELRRVREDGYIRVFSNWEDLKNIKNACDKRYELYPRLKVITAENKEEWLRKTLKMGYSYTGKISGDWMERMRGRILG